MNGLVISRETISGAEALNDVRATAGFDPLAFVVVDLVGADSSSSAVKLSSTDLRARDAGGPNNA
jgi:pantetheine-phosphate adenylyltransferase